MGVRPTGIGLFRHFRNRVDRLRSVICYFLRIGREQALGDAYLYERTWCGGIQEA